MSRKTKLTVGLTFLAVMAILVAGLLIPTLAGRDNPGGPATPVPAASSRPGDTSRPAARPGLSVGPSASAVCVDLAPKTLKAYLGEGRAQLRGSWFADAAEGLNVPLEDLAKQPLDTFTGTLNTGSDHSKAVCSVWTGLESPWIIKYRYDSGAGWLAVMVQGPAQGAYALPGRPKP